MLKAISKIFDQQIGGHLNAPDQVESEHAYQLATAALLMEISRADQDVSDAERDAVTQAVRRTFDLDDTETSALVELAEAEAEDATSLYDFTRLINDNFDHQQKQRVVEMLWQVAFADGNADNYEEHLIRRIADLIHVPHRGFIRAKLAAEPGSD